MTASPNDEGVVPVVPRGEEAHYEPVIVSGLDGTRTVGYRPEHSQLVDFLKKGRRVIPCALCGRVQPAGLLVTAHIKRRADCSDTERVNPRVVMPACALGCDSVYERGFIVVNDAGRIVRGFRGMEAPDLAPILDAVIGRTVLTFLDQNATFFAAHRRRHTRIARS